MKLIRVLPIILTLMSSSAYAVSDNGFPSVDAAAKAFLTPLMQGTAGVSASMNALPGDTSKLSSKQQVVVNPLSSVLTETVTTNGKLMSYLKTSQQLLYGGKVVKQNYTLQFLNGPKKNLMLRIMQPTMTGGYHIMDAQITNPVVLGNGLSSFSK
jgi:hypothetical protein